MFGYFSLEFLSSMEGGLRSVCIPMLSFIKAEYSLDKLVVLTKCLFNKQ